MNTDPLPYFILLAAAEFALGFAVGRRFPRRRRSKNPTVLYQYPRCNQRRS